MSITSTMVQFSQTNSYLAKVEGEGKIASTAKTAGRSVVLIGAGVVAAFEAAITGIAIGLLTAVAYATDRGNASLENAKARFASIKQTMTEVLGRKAELEEVVTEVPVNTLSNEVLEGIDASVAKAVAESVVPPKDLHHYLFPAVATVIGGVGIFELGRHVVNFVRNYSVMGIA